MMHEDGAEMARKNGYKIVQKLPDDIQNKIVEAFGNIEKFYAYVYYIGSLECKTVLSGSSLRIGTRVLQAIEDKLILLGLDSLDASDIINEIIMDAQEDSVYDMMEKTFGTEWKKIIEDYSKILGI